VTNPTLVDPKEVMARKLSVLRRYASKAILHGNSLAPDEEADQLDHMREFLATGESFSLTEKEMVDLIYSGLFRSRQKCGCHSCRARATE
jgi:hypothetical protein